MKYYTYTFVNNFIYFIIPPKKNKVGTQNGSYFIIAENYLKGQMRFAIIHTLGFVSLCIPAHLYPI